MTLPLKAAYFQRFLFSAGKTDLDVKPSGAFASRDITASYSRVSFCLRDVTAGL
jgi:hypothetical protein